MFHQSKFFDFFENTRATGGPNADAFNAFTKGYYFGNWYPDWKKAGTMDVAGAVRGAIFGSWGGPAGTLAGASAAALTSSTINVASQILGNLTGWW